MQRNKFRWFVKVWRLLNPDRRAMRTKKRRDLSFEVGDFVYLRVSPMRGTRRFKVKGKLAPRYVGPFKIVDHRGEVDYQLELPPQLSDVHDVFHVSQLKKCLRVPEEQLPIEELDLGSVLTYSERPVKILDTAERVTRNKVIKMCKVQWSHHTEDEASWEHEEELRADYPKLFPSASWISGWDSSNGGRFVTPTFYKNKILATKERIYDAYQFAVHMENLSKNKSCIGCIAWHGILYFSKILEELRRI
jgi:hypothetical protein